MTIIFIEVLLNVKFIMFVKIRMLKQIMPKYKIFIDAAFFIFDLCRITFYM